MGTPFYARGLLVLAMGTAVLPIVPLCAYHTPAARCCDEEPRAPQPRLLACCDLDPTAFPTFAALPPPPPRLPAADERPVRLRPAPTSATPLADAGTGLRPRAPPPVS